MFEFFGKNLLKRSRKAASGSAGNKTQKRSLFLESLEDRRLLAQDVTLTNLEIVSGTTSVLDGSSHDIVEGDILRFTGTTVDDGSSPDVAIDVELLLSRPSATASNQVHSDFSVDLGSDFDGQSIVSDQLYVGVANIPNTDTGGSVFTYDVVVTDDLLVELNEGFTVQLRKTLDPGGAAETQTNHYATEPTLTVLNTDFATITVSDITDQENDLASGAQTVTFTLDNPIDVEIAGLLAVNNGTAIEAGVGNGSNDYDVTSGTGAVTFQSGSDDADVVLNLNDENVVELDETFTVDLSSITVDGTALGSSPYASFLTIDTQSVVTIQNDDSATITVSDITNNETALDGASPLTVTYTLDAPIDVAITGTLGVNNGTATETGANAGDDDYDVGTIETFSVQNASDEVDANVNVNNDAVVERHETFTVDLTGIQVDGINLGASPYAGSLTIDTQALITIQNDDAAVVDISADQSANEGDSGTTSATYTVSSDAPISAAAGGTFTSTVSDGPAVGGAREGGVDTGSDDYDIGAGSDAVGAFWDGTANNLRTVIINGDEVVEQDETLEIEVDGLPADFAALTLADGITPAVTFGDDTATHTILNDDSGTFTISAVTDGAENTATFSATVQLDAQVELYGLGDLVINMHNDLGTGRTADHDTNAYHGTSDYVGATILLNFDGAAVNDTDTATFTVNGDAIVEIDEDFNASITANDLQGYGGDLTVSTTMQQLTIVNDDSATVTHSNLTGPEDEGDFSTFQLELSTSVQTATFLDDTVDDSPRLVTDFASGNATAGDIVGVQALADIDDGPAAHIGDNDFEQVNTDWQYQGGGPLTFDITVDHNQDIVVELEEIFRGNYTENDYLGYGPGGSADVILDADYDLGVINQEDTATIGLELSFATSPTTGSIIEGTNASNPQDFATHDYTIVLSDPVQDYAGTGFSVDNTTSDGTATQASGVGNGFEDYLAIVETVTFDLDVNNPAIQPLGADAQTAPKTVSIREDETVELDENFTLEIEENDFGPYGSIGTGQLTLLNPVQTITIVNDDAATLQVLDTTVDESAGTVTVDVLLDYPVDVDFMVDYNATDGTALHSTNTSSAAAANQEWEWDGGVWQDQASLTFDANTDAGVEDGDPGAGFIDQADPGNGSYAEVQSITFDILDDDVVELNEDFYVNIFNLSGIAGRDVSIADDDGQVLVLNDDVATVSVNSVVVNEGDATATVSVSLSNAVDAPVSVVASTADDTATAGSDYTANSETKTFPALAAASQDFVVTLGADDSLVELDEVLDVLLSDLFADGREVAMGTSDGTITITDNDTASLSVALAGGGSTVNEGDGTITFDVSLSNPVAVPVTVNFGAQNPTMPGSYDDFAGGVGSITFAAGNNTTQTFTVDIYDDAVVELDENLEVVLFGLDAGEIQDADNSDVTISGPSDTFTVIDNDSAQISINDVTITERHHGQSTAILTVSLDTAVDVPVDVEVDTADVSAVAADSGNSGDEDYDAIVDGNVRFAGTAGETQQIAVTINGDEVVELDEVLNVILSNISASGREADITFADNTGTVTIDNDDSATVSIQETGSADESAGTIDLVVTLSSPVDVAVTVDADDVAGTAVRSGPNPSDLDYDQVDVTLSYSPVAGSPLQYNVTVDLNDENVVELDETLQVVLSALGAGGRAVTLDNDTADVTIVNDDSATVTINNTIVDESAGTATLLVSLSQPVDVSTTVDWTTLDDTAIAAFGDYTADTDQVVFPALSTTDQPIAITIADDDIVELEERLHVALLDPLAAGGRDVSIESGPGLFEGELSNVEASGAITITDNDTASLSVALAGGGSTVNEGDGTITFDVSLSNPVAVPVTVNFGAQNPTMPGSYDDFAGGVGSITFAAGNNTTQTFTVDIYDDAVVELDENLEVVLFGLDAGEIQDADNSDVTISGPSDTFTVIDNDSAQISINDVTITERHHGQSTAILTVSLDTAVDVPVDVEVDTADVSAVAADSGNSGDEDYDAIVDGNVRFAGTAGETQQIAVTINGDEVVELDEVLNVILSNISASGREADITFADNTGTVTIDNDDSATVSIQETGSADESAGTIDLVVTLSSPVDVAVTVDADDVAGTAVRSGPNPSDLDYDQVDVTLSYSPVAGSPLQYNVTVDLNDENVVELDETLQVVLSALGAGGRAVTLDNDTADVTIVNDDSATVTINNTIVDESAGTATLLVSLSQPVDVSTTVDWTTLDDTAIAAFGDYTADTDQVVFPALSTTDQPIAITIADDDIVELEERLHVALLDPLAAGGRDVSIESGPGLFEGELSNVEASGSITITNNDSATFEIHADEDYFAEGDDGITTATLTVTLSNPVDIPILINYATANGTHNSANNDGLAAGSAPEYFGVNSTADNENPTDPPGYYDFVNSALTDDHDYDDTEGTLNFTAVNNGLVNGEITQTISIPIYGDEIVELDEWLSVAISSSDVLGRSVTIDKAEDYVWIDNDDEATFSISDVSVVEGDVGQRYAILNVLLDQAVDVPVSVVYTTVDVTATSATTLFHGDEDYEFTMGTLNFAGAEGEVQEIRVAINGDLVVELDELFEVQLSDVQAQNRDVTIADGDGVVTIENDDSATVRIKDVAVEEGDVGTTTATSMVIMSAPVDVPVTTPFTSADGTAEAPVDYTATAGLVSFGNLKTDPLTYAIDVSINGDIVFERHENMFIELGVLDSGLRDVTYLDTDILSGVEAKIDIVNDDRNENNFIAPCNIIAEPGDVDLDDGTRYAAWDVSFSHDGVMDIQFTAATATGETLEIGVPLLLDSSGDAIAAQKVDHVSAGDPTVSYGVYRVAAGDYTVVVPSGNDEDGLIELVVSLPGILSETDTSVTDLAFHQTAAGVLQTQLGYRGTTAEVFYERLGIDLAVDQYDACLDVDRNGGLTIFDLASIAANRDAGNIDSGSAGSGGGVPSVSLLEDRFNTAEILDVDPMGDPIISVSELFAFSLHQNPNNELDVNDDGHVTPIDALVTINSLNDEGSRSNLVVGDELVMPGDTYFFDTNGDFAITPIDVLHVINALNAAEGEGEGESVGEGESATDVIFGGYEGVTIQATDFDATVEALSVEVDAAETGQEYYTTPVQETSWSSEIDSVLEDLGQDEEQTQDLDDLLN